MLNSKVSLRDGDGGRSAQAGYVSIRGSSIYRKSVDHELVQIRADTLILKESGNLSPTSFDNIVTLKYQGIGNCFFAIMQ